MAGDRSDSSSNLEAEREKERDRDDRAEKGSKQPKSSSSKAKDLSHVPCKFFKVGSCTAGSSCPFSHASQEPGGQKDTCAWFVKGNCKFGHKCALAHILPGQPMAMDRKNKKAAQVAAGGGREKGSRGSRKDSQAPPSRASLAPNRGLQSSRPPITMSLKASISPSAPAPALKDTDFSSFGALEEASKLPMLLPPSLLRLHPKDQPKPDGSSSSPGSLPVSTPRRTNLSPHKPPIDFGSNAASPHSRVNGNGIGTFSPGTSPAQRNINGNFTSSSPFSAPHTSSVLFNYPGEQGRAGLAASLGTGLTMGGSFGGRSAWNADVGGISSSHVPSSNLNAFGRGDFDLEDDTRGEDKVTDGEMFLPGSLSELLTAEEINRRKIQQSEVQVEAPHRESQLGLGVPIPSGPQAATSGHRHSRSVPAPSLLSDVGSIWSDASHAPPVPPIPAGLPSSPTRIGFGNGTPTSFTSAASGFGGRSYDPLGEGESLLAPSNASGAFLPGLHQQYFQSKQNSSLGLGGSGRGVRNTSNPIFSQPGATAAGISNYLQSGPGGDTYLPGGRPIPTQPQQHQPEDLHLMSPNARALHAHAPGQSLPQGLAAGYSRIHAQPPVLVASPGSTGIGGFSMSPGLTNVFNPGPYGTNTSDDCLVAGVNSGNNGLDSFSKLSYSAAAATRGSSSGGSPGRNVTGSFSHRPRLASSGGPLSPLSGPVVTRDDVDDDGELFSMDG
ncbi:uncharacterized protein EV420DRAFT_1556864 [Desarmillaria tabescens]|uniref:C3H1-type domain-containing protein n=1 Tax=Armillaria tabescens TaxID=1929756 RepID=A0AA39N148_ARMTA|nr:uncharacterized protein EV420DRAFT_1556864 [Desarmillaria tabescens]KAK0454112.1 hypothetical protein EV420DRAFT_1556864 [Desarmillaria tabescens]